MNIYTGFEDKNFEVYLTPYLKIDGFLQTIDILPSKSSRNKGYYAIKKPIVFTEKENISTLLNQFFNELGLHFLESK